MSIPENAGGAPKFNYWAKMASKRSIATLLLTSDDEDAGNNGTIHCREPHHSQYIMSLGQNTSPMSDVHFSDVSAGAIISSTFDLRSSEAAPSSSARISDTVANASQAINSTANSLKSFYKRDKSVADTNARERTEETKNGFVAATTKNIEIPEDPNIVANTDAGTANSSFNSMLSIFDLTNVGLSTTLAIGIFLVVGHVIRHITGAAATLSIIIAAACSFLAGSYFSELNYIAATPPLMLYPPNSGDNYIADTRTLLPAYIFIHACIGELFAFVIGWNLILDYVIAVALASKGIAAYFDVLIFGSIDFVGAVNGGSLTKDWQNWSSYFDVFSFFIPILIAGPLVLVMRRTTFLNLFTVASGFVAVVIVLIVGIFEADITNLTAKLPTISANDSSIPPQITGSGGFLPYGIEGVLHGAAIFTFLFIGFDTMVLGANKTKNDKYIRSFKKTIPASIISINGLSFLCLLGVSVAITLIQPYFTLNSEILLQLASSRSRKEWQWVTFTILGCGLLGLIGSLYTLMHAILRVSQMMSADGLAFELFGEFEHNKQPAIAGCLIFSLLSALLAGLLDNDHLIKLLSMGALMMFLGLTLAIVMIRYTPIVDFDNGPFNFEHGGGGPHVSYAPPAVSLTAIMLLLYCIFAASLSIFIQLIRSQFIVLANGLVLVIVPTFLILMCSLVLGIGMQNIQPLVKRFKAPFNPLLPGLNIFVCIYLLSTFEAVQWLRFFIWTLLGISMYLICMRRNVCNNGILPGTKNGGMVINTGYTYEETENNLTVVTEMEETTVSLEAIKTANDEITNNALCAVLLRSVIPDIIPKLDKITSIDNLQSDIKLETPIAMGKKLAFRLSKPRNDFDEIVPAEYVKETCIEMKERNGNIFFIEQSSKRARDIAVEGEAGETIALGTLDRVLKAEDSQKNNTEEAISKSKMQGSVESETIYEVVENLQGQGRTMEWRDSPQPSNSGNRTITSCDHTENAKEDLSIGDHDHNQSNMHDGPSSPSSSELKIAIVERHRSKTKPLFEIDSSEVTCREPKLPKFTASQECQFQVELTQPARDDNPKPAHLMTSASFTHSNASNMFELETPRSVNSPPSPQAGPAILLTSVSRKIPIAPQFDPILYNTISAHSRSKPPATAQAIENELRLLRPFVEAKLRRAPNTQTLHKSNGSNEVVSNDDHVGMTTIRQRLEQMLGRGPSSTHNTNQLYTIPVPDYPDAPTEVAEVAEATIRPSDECEIIPFKKPLRPFDTVHKQKVLFSDVLKSISPEIQTSLHRTDSTTSSRLKTTVHDSSSRNDGKRDVKSTVLIDR